MNDDFNLLSRRRSQQVQSLRRIEEERLAQKAAEEAGLNYQDLKSALIDGEALTLRDVSEQKSAKVAIIRKHGQRLTLAAQDPSSEKLKNLKESLQKEGFILEPLLVVSLTSLRHAWDLYEKFAYLQTKITGEVKIQPETLLTLKQEIDNIRNLKTLIEHTAASNTSDLLEVFLAGALKLNASDIHIEPKEEARNEEKTIQKNHEQKNAKIRYRLDGILYDLTEITFPAYRLLLSRIKLLSGLKLNVTNDGQDGRFSIFADNHEINIRTSTLPGHSGEFVVMRVLNPKDLLDIGELGLRDDLLTIISKELEKPNGMVLTTGPTGSGKTTMLYAFLKKVTNPTIKTITIEDPIEYHIAGIEQTQVDPKSKYTFENGLRSIVRQDPDVILVGEIRDKETASIAMHAALTGHLVFSTLHTNDAAGAIPRLVDMGIDPNILGPAVNVAMAQRLVRRVCQKCSAEIKPPAELIEKIKNALRSIKLKTIIPDLNKISLKESRECIECHNTGYSGRIGIFEIFLINDQIKKLILKKPSITEIRDAAIAQGMVTLQQDALLRALQGVTTIDEVIRITGPLA